MAVSWDKESLASVSQNRPQFSPSEGEKLASEIFGLRAIARPLPSERDQNFYLRDQSGGEFVLKIASSHDAHEILDLQNQALRHIAEREPSIRVPRLCSALSGGFSVIVPGINGARHAVRLLTFIPGALFAEVRPHSPVLLRSLGSLYGALARALENFSHPAADRRLHWDLRIANEVIRSLLPNVEDPRKRNLIEPILASFETIVLPRLPHLRLSVIHNDGNDYNVLVAGAGLDRRVIGIIDFGDMLRSITVGDLAITVAYAILGKANPIAAACQVVSGFYDTFPLREEELEVLHTLIAIRLATSITLSSYQQKLAPENRYLSISEKPALEALERLATRSADFAHYSFRRACRFEPCPKNGVVVNWLRQNRDSFASVVDCDLATESKLVFDLSAASRELEDPGILCDAESFTRLIFTRIKESGARIGIGQYDEARLCYSGDQYRIAFDDFPETRTVHLGIDLFLEPGSPVYAPLHGIVHSFRDNTQSFDYGPTVILEHRIPGSGSAFYTLYGHLSRESLHSLVPGMQIWEGMEIGTIGKSEENGGWPPHLHFEIILDLLGREGEFPGVAAPSEREVWLSICPDPNLILGIPQDCFPSKGWSPDRIRAGRERNLGPNLSLAYRRPLHIVRGYMQRLFDLDGQPYLDAVNNVAHVGHSHPRVVRAVREQMAVLNTNTRYLHENVVRYADRVCATLPDSLSVCYFVCSGSEANDLALRLARAHTGGRGLVVSEGAYHGNLTSLIDISPYKFDGPGGEGAPDHVQTICAPDGYRGPYKYSDPLAGAKYARLVAEAIGALRDKKRDLSAFICESILSCAGQIVLPPGFLREAYSHVRASGGVCIADEVQVGFGRVGSHFWGFETQGVVPDIVTMGKPIGNGHPLGLVVTTPEIAASFNKGMEYFNTYGGNPVSCAAGMAVLDVIEDQHLQKNAAVTGSYLKAGLEGLKGRHTILGDVRGMGLFLGFELVLDHQALAPAPDQALYLIERMKDRGILLSKDGPFQNVIKIKPPLVFGRSDADNLLKTLDEILSEDFLLP